jgi:hypothetical protein
MRKDEDEATTATWMQQSLHMELTHLSLFILLTSCLDSDSNNNMRKDMGSNNREMDATIATLGTSPSLSLFC